MKKFKFFLLIPILSFIHWSLPAHGAAITDALTSAAASYTCPPPFVKIDGKPCCTFKPSCPAGYEISQSCGNIPPNAVQLTFCCVKKEIPFNCPKPAEVVMMPPEQCKRLNGVPDPNVSIASTGDARCCFNCAKAGVGYAMINGITSKEKCQPIPPNLFFPTSSGSAEGKCCAKSGATPTPTPFPSPSPSPGSSTSVSTGSTGNSSSLNGVCQIYQGCVVGTVNGQQGCYTSASVSNGTFQACSPAAYLWTNASGLKQCCRNAQP